MAVRWESPCGCKIQFVGNAVDTDEPVSEYIIHCSRHTQENVQERLNTCISDNRLHSSVTNFIMNLYSESETPDAWNEVLLWFGDTGPLNIANLASEYVDLVETEFGETVSVNA